MNTAARSGLGALVLLLCATSLRPPLQAAETLVIGGTGSAIGVMRRLAEAYQDTAAAQPIEVLPSLGTGGGLRALADARIDIALAARPLKPHEREGKQVQVFARTPLAFVASDDVTAPALSTKTLIAFYQGTQTRWPDGMRARPVLRPWHDAETQVLAAWSEPLAEVLAEAVYRTDLQVTMTTQENLEAIEQTPGAFGYTPLTEVVTAQRALQVLTLEGVEPTPAQLAAGRYPLVLNLALVTGPASPDAAQAFIAFVRSPSAAAILRSAGCLPVAP
ncbi:MAG: solute-binding protein [Gammaproteobacteria bacterium]|nr:solute-binding protein [Gammaproteobacteria bacterium]